MVRHASHSQRKLHLFNVNHHQCSFVMYLRRKINSRYELLPTVELNVSWTSLNNHFSLQQQQQQQPQQQQQQQQTTYQHILNSSDNSNSSSASSVASGSTSSAPNGQYILVQRAGVIAGSNHSAPRASSAPPAQNQVSCFSFKSCIIVCMWLGLCFERAEEIFDVENVESFFLNCYQMLKIQCKNA